MASESSIINHMLGKEHIPHVRKDNVKCLVVSPTYLYGALVIQPLFLKGIPKEEIVSVKRVEGVPNALLEIRLREGNTIEFASAENLNIEYKPDIIWIEGENISDKVVQECRSRAPRVLYRS